MVLPLSRAVIAPYKREHDQEEEGDVPFIETVISAINLYMAHMSLITEDIFIVTVIVGGEIKTCLFHALRMDEDNVIVTVNEI